MDKCDLDKYDLKYDDVLKEKNISISNKATSVVMLIQTTLDVLLKNLKKI